MPRHKNYSEEEVTSKALKVFWSNGYHDTSARILQDEMGINAFSIYSSFKNKEGVLLACAKNYKQLFRKILLVPLEERPHSISSIKKFFTDFLSFTKDKNIYRGCLLINLTNEVGQDLNPDIAAEIKKFSSDILDQFYNIMLSIENKKSVAKQKARYLFMALQGIALTSKWSSKQDINNYLELTFSNM